MGAEDDPNSSHPPDLGRYVIEIGPRSIWLLKAQQTLCSQAAKDMPSNEPRHVGVRCR